MRLIDADKLECVSATMPHEASEDYKEGYGDGMNYVLDIIDDLPTIDPVEWIPVSERLPKSNEKDGRGFLKAYLVQDARWMDVARWDGDNWIAWGYGTRLENVGAWMPLPEPYKEENR